LEEFRTVTAARLASLRAMPVADFAREWRTPIGLAPYRDFLQLRAFDCWVHEQDMRRAINRPGHRDGPVAARALQRMVAALPYVVGRKVRAPEGATIVFRLHGEGTTTPAVVMEGRRARLLDHVPATPSATIGMDTETFMCLTCGRWEPQVVLDAGKVQIEGDDALGRTVVAQLNVMM
jgi:uncharacterized protein (TIGR03083 family)